MIKTAIQLKAKIRNVSSGTCKRFFVDYFAPASRSFLSCESKLFPSFFWYFVLTLA